MSILGNILWIILGGGIFLFIEYVISGLLLCLTIVGIPFGFQCIKLGVLALAPFGREVRNLDNATGCLSTLMNILWIFIGGIWISATHIIFAIVLAVTIIGLPFAKQHIKLAALAITPFGKDIV